MASCVNLTSKLTHFSETDFKAGLDQYGFMITLITSYKSKHQKSV